MTEVTRILHRIETGDAHAAEELLPRVYDELRRLAAHELDSEPAGNTLQPTALVHEAYVRLVDQQSIFLAAVEKTPGEERNSWLELVVSSVAKDQ